MMRQIQVRQARKANRKALITSTASGPIAWFRQLVHLQLGLTLVALAASVVLLFVGTFVYLDANSSSTSSGRSATYDRILALYGINEADFEPLFPSHHHHHQHPSAITISGNNNNNNHFKLLNYQIGISMMFVAVISILIEVGLICAILFEHFKLTALYSLIMAGGLLYGLSNSGQVYALSLTFQLGFLVAFVVFALGIRVRSLTADRILAKGGGGGGGKGERELVELGSTQALCGDGEQQQQQVNNKA